MGLRACTLMYHSTLVGAQMPEESCAHGIFHISRTWGATWLLLQLLHVLTDT